MSYWYKKLFYDLREIVNKYDPNHLIEGGAPEDEYDSYVPGVISLFVNNKIADSQSAAVSLRDYFTERFGKDAELSEGVYLDFANEVLNYLKGMGE